MAFFGRSVYLNPNIKKPPGQNQNTGDNVSFLLYTVHCNWTDPSELSWDYSVCILEELLE
jgi:hypothetical protein